MATYVSRIRALSQSTISYTTDAQVAEFADAGAKFVIQNIPKKLLWFIYSDSTNITTSVGFTVPQNTIISARRGSYVCDFIDEHFAYAQSSTLTSFYEGTALFPKAFIQSGKAYIKPDPTVGAVGVITYVSITTISTATSDTGTIAPMNNPLIYHAAGLDSMAISTYYNQLSTDSQDALDKAKYLIDSATNLSSGAQDAEYYLSITSVDSQDTEMVDSTVRVAQQEISRATVAITNYNQKSQLFSVNAKNFFQLAENEIEKYIKRGGQ